LYWFFLFSWIVFHPIYLMGWFFILNCVYILSSTIYLELFLYFYLKIY
jgi:hypothetical protein